MGFGFVLCSALGGQEKLGFCTGVFAFIWVGFFQFNLVGFNFCFLRDKKGEFFLDSLKFPSVTMGPTR